MSGLDPMQMAIIAGAGLFTAKILSQPPLVPATQESIAEYLRPPLEGDVALPALVRGLKLVDLWESSNGTKFARTNEGLVVEWTTGWVSEYFTMFGESPFAGRAAAKK